MSAGDPAGRFFDVVLQADGTPEPPGPSVAILARLARRLWPLRGPEAPPGPDPAPPEAPPTP
jgi:hypothetical protein